MVELGKMGIHSRVGKAAKRKVARRVKITKMKEEEGAAQDRLEKRKSENCLYQD